MDCHDFHWLELYGLSAVREKITSVSDAHRYNMPASYNTPNGFRGSCLSTGSFTQFSPRKAKSFTGRTFSLSSEFITITHSFFTMAFSLPSKSGMFISVRFEVSL